MPDEPVTSSRRFPIWETVSVFLAIAALWPAYILRWPGPVWRWLSYAMLGVMIAVALHRLARDAEAKRRKEAEQGQEGRARLPWEPPGPADT